MLSKPTLGILSLVGGTLLACAAFATLVFNIVWAGIMSSASAGESRTALDSTKYSIILLAVGVLFTAMGMLAARPTRVVLEESNDSSHRASQ